MTVNMLLGLLLAFFVYLSPVVLYNAGSEYSTNKFLITDGIYRKIPTKNSRNGTRDSIKKLVLDRATTREPEVTQSVRDNVSEVLTTEQSQPESEPVLMNQVSSDNIRVVKNISANGKNGGAVNHEHLIGQILECDPIYELQCGGSQCVQILEGATKCAVDMCQGKVLIACRNGQGCYSQKQHCDGIVDCEDSSDEMSCLSLVQVHDERHFYTRTVPFMAILCLMGVAASFVLYHQTNAARQRQRHLSMVGLTHALTSAGIAQGVERPHEGRSWRIHDGPETDLLRDFSDPIPPDPLEPVGITTHQLEQVGGDLHEFEQVDPSAQQLQLLANGPDLQSCCERPLVRRTFSERGQDYFGYCGYHDSRRDPGAPPPYETALEMGTIKASSHGQHEPEVSESSSYGDPPPYESVSHITCTSVVPVTDV